MDSYELMEEKKSTLAPDVASARGGVCHQTCRAEPYTCPAALHNLQARFCLSIPQSTDGSSSARPAPFAHQNTGNISSSFYSYIRSFSLCPRSQGPAAHSSKPHPSCGDLQELVSGIVPLFLCHVIRSFWERTLRCCLEAQ
jgi:hypothetical protein